MSAPTIQIPIAAVQTDGGTQMRFRVNPEKVDEYAALKQDGVVFPPLDVVEEDGVYWLWDGFTRLAADKQIGATVVAVRVTPGTLSDARWLSYGANRDHGQPRTNREKWAATKAALEHPASAELSDREIARHVGVSNTFVGTVRRAAQSPEASAQAPKRRVNAARIGRGSPIRQLESWWRQAPQTERAKIKAWVLAQTDA